MSLSLFSRFSAARAIAMLALRRCDATRSVDDWRIRMRYFASRNTLIILSHHLRYASSVGGLYFSMIKLDDFLRFIACRRFRGCVYYICSRRRR